MAATLNFRHSAARYRCTKSPLGSMALTIVGHGTSATTQYSTQGFARGASRKRRTDSATVATGQPPPAGRNSLRMAQQEGKTETLAAHTAP